MFTTDHTRTLNIYSSRIGDCRSTILCGLRRIERAGMGLECVCAYESPNLCNVLRDIPTGRTALI